MQLGDFYDLVNSIDKEKMSFTITDVFSWRGSYDEVCFSLDMTPALTNDNLAVIQRAFDEEFEGYKGGEYFYDASTEVNFESDSGNCTSQNYLNMFLKKYKDDEDVKYIFKDVM